MTRLSVVVDVSAVPADPRGAGRFVVELVGALDRRGNVELILLGRRNDEHRWRSLAPSAAVKPVVPDARPMRLVWEQVAGPRAADRSGADVYHGPHYTMPERARVPKIVTIHDMTFFDHPEWHERAKVPVFRRAIRRAAAHADMVVCDAEAVARRVRDLLDPKCPVEVVPIGVDHGRFRPDGDVAEDESAIGALGVRAPYVAFLGTFEPRKGVGLLARAFDLIAGRHPDLQLVLAGGRGWGESEIQQAIDSARHRDRILLPGYVPDDAVPALLRRAVAVAYPSLEEGFGIPALEALACGAPLITTAGSVMHDFAGDAATVVPAGDVDALAAALDEVVSSGANAGRRTAGLEVASRHTWDAAAERYEQLYASVVRGFL